MGLGSGRKHEASIALSSSLDQFSSDGHLCHVVLRPEGWGVSVSREMDLIA